MGNANEQREEKNTKSKPVVLQEVFVQREVLFRESDDLWPAWFAEPFFLISSLHRNSESSEHKFRKKLLQSPIK